MSTDGKNNLLIPIYIASIAILFIIGLLNQYSALGGWTPAFRNHFLKLIIVFFAFFSTFCIKEHVLERLIPVGYFLSIILLSLVEFKGLTVKGATRWIQLGSLTMQPSELAKIFTPLMSAHLIYIFRQESKKKMLIAVLISNIIPFILVLKQPDLGSAILVISAGLLPLLLSDIKLKYFFITAFFGLMTLPFAWNHLHQYQRDRVLTLINPERDPTGQGYHVLQSKIAIGSGQWFGKGFLFNTQADYDFLPEHDTDFAFALFAEEHGFIGSIFVISLFFYLSYLMMKICLATKSYYSQLIIFSLAAPLFIYVFINIGMVTGILPVVGVPLPFFSRGGTNLLSVFFSFGLIISLYLSFKNRF